jgi:hypothetical protein
MVRKSLLTAGFALMTCMLAGEASAHGYRYARPVVVARPAIVARPIVVARPAVVPVYRAPVYAVPVYQPVPVYRPPVYGPPVYRPPVYGFGVPNYGYGPRGGVSINIGVGGPVYRSGYGRYPF